MSQNYITVVETDSVLSWSRELDLVGSRLGCFFREDFDSLHIIGIHIDLAVLEIFGHAVER